MSTIYLEPKQVPPYLRGAYGGKKFRLVLTAKITVPADAGCWEGGSRDYYSFVELATGRSVPVPGQQSAPWNGCRREIQAELPFGVGMVVHTIACGKDLGLTFYVRADNAAKLLPSGREAELSENQKIVLEATASLKASYNGRDRYANARPYGAMSRGEVAGRLAKVEELFAAKGDVKLQSGKLASERIAELKGWTEFFPSREEWEAAKAELSELGYLNKAGAITVKGRNARGMSRIL